jgi:hypothetical protein
MQPAGPIPSLSTAAKAGSPQALSAVPGVIALASARKCVLLRPGCWRQQGEDGIVAPPALPPPVAALLRDPSTVAAVHGWTQGPERRMQARSTYVKLLLGADPVPVRC